MAEPQKGRCVPESTAAASEPASPAIGTFSLTLQPTYCRTGFFNVGVSSEKFLGADGETIELFLGSESEPILEQ
jgi:hypothetical protein